MGHKAKVWLILLIVITVVTFIRVLYAGGNIGDVLLALAFNLLFWLFLIMFIIRLLGPGEEKKNISSSQPKPAEPDLSNMSEQERYDYLYKKMNHLD